MNVNGLDQRGKQTFERLHATPKRTLSSRGRNFRDVPFSDIGTDLALQLPRSRQLVQQRLRLFQISGIEPLGEPAVDWGEEAAALSGSLKAMHSKFRLCLGVTGTSCPAGRTLHRPFLLGRRSSQLQGHL